MAPLTISQMTSLAKKAEGTKVGYDQGQRWSFLDKKNKSLISNKETDCSALCAGIAYLAGYPINISGTCWTGNLDVLFKAAGWKVLKYTNKNAVKAGDVVLKKKAHAVFAISKTEWLSAEADERGKASGGQAGDQTGKEVRIRAPYERSGGWDYILRPPADSVAPTPPPKPSESYVTVTAQQLANALAKVGSSTTRSQVQVRRDGTKVPTSLAALADQLTKDLAGRKLNPHAVAAFVATMMQESAWLATTVEYGSKDTRYDPYRGRTFEQLTWKDNYAGFGSFCKAKGLVDDANYFVKNPELLGDLKWAWLGGVWYFDNRKIWDEAETGDFQRIQTTVNFGSPSISKVPAGWTQRLSAYRGFLSVYSKPKLLDVNGDPQVLTWTRLQEFIGAEMDGEIGAQSNFLMGVWLGLDGPFNLNNASHVKKLQKKVGLDAHDQDGVWWQPKTKKYGPVTSKALQAYLNNNR